MSSAPELPTEDQVRAAAEALDGRGYIFLPAGGWPGASGVEVSKARERFYRTIELLGERRLLRVFEDDEGGTCVLNQARVSVN